MLETVHRRTLGSFALIGALSAFSTSAASVKTVLVIAMENHNWTQPIQVPGGVQQIFGNPNAPFINGLVNGNALAIINGWVVSIASRWPMPRHTITLPPNDTGASPGDSSFRAQLYAGGSRHQLWCVQR